MPLNVLKGEPKSPDYLQRHPFGKVAEVDHDGLRIPETAAITRYLTPDADRVFDVPGFADWWARVQALPSYQGTQPNLG